MEPTHTDFDEKDIEVKLGNLRQQALALIEIDNSRDDNSTEFLQELWEKISEKNISNQQQFEELKIDHELLATENQLLKQRLKDLCKSHAHEYEIPVQNMITMKKEQMIAARETVVNKVSNDEASRTLELSKDDDSVFHVTLLQNKIDELMKIFQLTHTLSESSEATQLLLHCHQQIIGELQNELSSIRMQFVGSRLSSLSTEQEQSALKAKHKYLEQQVRSLKQEQDVLQKRYKDVCDQSYSMQSNLAHLQDICLKQEYLIRVAESKKMNREDRKDFENGVENSLKPTNEFEKQNHLLPAKELDHANTVNSTRDSSPRDKPNTLSPNLLQKALRELNNISGPALSKRRRSNDFL